LSTRHVGHPPRLDVVVPLDLAATYSGSPSTTVRTCTDSAEEAAGTRRRSRTDEPSSGARGSTYSGDPSWCGASSGVGIIAGGGTFIP
jgi:hypothetical protein